jgi:fatty-acyl-CoA synthase
MAWIDFLEEVKDQYASATALIEQSSDRTLNYQQLWDEVNSWASYLQEMGVVKGDRVAFLKSNCLEHVTLFLGCAKLGAIFVPLNFRLAKNEVSEIIERTDPKIFIGSGECELNLSRPKTYIKLEDISLKEALDFPTCESTLNDPLLMLFTSGTTGTPKGVLFHGAMLAENQKQTCENWGLLSSDKTLVETPFFHTGGYNVLCLPLMSIGGTSVLAEKFDLDNVFSSVDSLKLTVYFAVPTMFQMISEDERFKNCTFESVRFFISGGAYCAKELIEAYQKKGLMFKQGFGLTEVGPNCFLLDEGDAIEKLGSIGKPMPHSEVMLIREDGEVAEEGEVGELLIRGPHVCAGYFLEPQRFSDSLFDGFFKTGDLAKVDKDGFYFIVGRKKDMYISGGENVYPAEVEKKIVTHSFILEAAVVAVESEKWGEVGFAFLRSVEPVEVGELRDYLNPLLSRYKHPHFVMNVSEFPCLASGKIDRKELLVIAKNQMGQLNQNSKSEAL